MIIKNWEIDRTLYNSSLILKMNKNELSEYQIRMIQNNNIEKLIKAQTKIIDDIGILKYPILNKLTLFEYGKQYFFNYKILKELIEALIETITELNEYLLEEGNLLINGDKIFIDISNMKFYFIYIPTNLINVNVIKDTEKLILELFKYIHKSDEKAIGLIHKFKIIMEENCSNIFSLKEIIRSEDNIIHKEYIPIVDKNGDNKEISNILSKKDKKLLRFLKSKKRSS